MEDLWQQALAWGSESSLNTIIFVVAIILVVSAIVSFLFRAVKIGIVVIILLLLVGVSPTVMTSWVSSHMDAKNFGASKIENATTGFLSLPTDWKATLPTGAAYICSPDLTPEGIGGLNCDKLFYSDDAVKTAVKTNEGLTVTLLDGKTIASCKEVKAGYGCATTPAIKLKYTAPKD